MRVGFLIFPEFTQLDMTGAQEVFSRMPDTEVLLLWKSREAVSSDGGMHILPNGTLEDCPHLDLICVPGGPGIGALLEDEQVLRFLRERGRRAQFVTSVCTGSLVLGAAGLLQGYRATTHWLSKELLSLCGAIPAAGRVVVDRNRVTGAGVTSGIDMALRVAALAYGDDMAREIQLRLEYCPEPLFACGQPETTPAEIVERVKGSLADVIEERRALLARAAQRLPAG